MTLAIYCLLAGSVAAGLVISSAPGLKPADRICRMIAPTALLVSIILLLVQICNTATTKFILDASRLAPALSVFHGYPLYNGPETGPIVSMLSPPLAFLVYAPAALATTPLTACLISRVISVIFYFGPFLLALLTVRRNGFFLASCLALFGLLTYLADPLRYISTAIHADAPAVGFAALACWVLTREAKKPAGLLTLAGAAALAVCAVWSRQMFLAVLPVLVIHVVKTRGKKTGAAFAGWLLLMLLLSGAVWSAFFGWDKLYFNIIQVPSQQPFGLGRPASIWTSAASLFFKISIIPIVLAAWALTHSLRPDRTRPADAPRGAGFGHASLLLAVGGILLPISVITITKVEADVNHFGYALYFLVTGSILAMYASGVRDRDGSPTADASAGSLADQMLVPIFCVALLTQNLPGFGKLQESIKHPLSVSHRSAAQFIKAHPDQIYFPCEPLLRLFAQNKLDHILFGIMDRENAGLVISDEHFAAYTPSRLQYVAFPAVKNNHNYREIFKGHKRVDALRLEFDKKVPIPGMEDWDIYERSGPG